MKKEMEDIQIIGGDLAYDKIQILPSTYDRVQAIFYHCRSIETHCSHQDFLKATWHFRCALTEFNSLFDVLRHDLKTLQLIQIWDKSNFLQNLEKSSLIRILRKSRDLAIHSANIKGDVHKFLFTYIDGNREHENITELIFIDSISREYSRDKLSNFSDDDIDWFNRQAKYWPAHLLIEEAVFLACVEIINFLTENKNSVPD